MTTFYDFSGGMESAAMLVVDRERIQATDAIVRFADTGKQFPEMTESIQQIEQRLGLHIVTVPQRLTFEEFLFERGGMLRKGMTDCSRRMKRSNLNRHAATLQKPWEINLGFNASEDDRAESFLSRNERPWCHWRFPLIEAGITREATWDICRKAGFSVLVGMYEKMGRFDCYFCPNQRPAQAMKVIEHYPDLAAEWMAYEDRKGHSFLSIPLRLLPAEMKRREDERAPLFACACFGGDEDVFADDPAQEPGWQGSLANWQPMDTYPKSSAPWVLLWWPYWSSHPVVGRWEASLGDWWAQEKLEGAEEGPRGWMPLPAPPVAAQEPSAPSPREEPSPAATRRDAPQEPPTVRRATPRPLSKREKEELGMAERDADPAQEPGWQPIETAPKDGTDILVFHNGYASVVWWEELGDGWIVAALAEQSIYAPNPTHWMPLPSPPPTPPPQETAEVSPGAVTAAERTEKP